MNIKKYLTFSIILSLISNALYGEIKDDEEVLFYPTYATINGEKINVQIHGHVFEREEDSIIRSIMLKGLRSALDVPENKLATKLFNERMRNFMVDNQRYKKVKIRLGNKLYKLKRTKANGHLTDELKLKATKLKINLNKNPIIDFQAILPKEDKRIFKGKVQIINQKGISVISDLDDTIKDSNVLNKKQLIKNTFQKPFKAVPRMAKYYQQLKKGGAVFHYVSGSPWQLYEPIAKFIKRGNFPEGSVHLKYLRIKDSSIIKFIVADQKSYKLKIVKKILQDFPLRKFILIGDSGEKDPEIYADIARLYKKQVKAIYIRNVGNRTQADFDKLFNDFTEIEIKIFKTGKDLLQ